MACLAASFVSLSAARAANVIIVFDFTNLNIQDTVNVGSSTIRTLGNDFRVNFGGLFFELNGYRTDEGSSTSQLGGLAYTSGLGFGVYSGNARNPQESALDGAGGNESLNVLIRGNPINAVNFAVNSFSWTDAGSDPRAFANGGWTVNQGSDDWQTDRDPRNTNKSNEIVFYNTNGGANNNGNRPILDLRDDGEHVFNAPQALGFNGFNAFVGANRTAVYLSGLSLEFNEDDARALQLLPPVAPIPVPPSAVLMLSAVGLGALAHRRNAKSKMVAA
ncbi:MAG: hypothetical protein AAF862_05850 [Pseudomonadota bacterium]